MAESERRRKYRYNRVLIETARILNPEFHDAVVFLSGAQIEMLRNVTQYLNRLETYVTEYASGYYLAPTAADYDKLLEIVADLEETLMGNPNTIWGYADVCSDVKQDLAMPAGESNMYGNEVPAGQVWRLLNLSSWIESASCTKVRLRAMIGGKYLQIEEEVPPTSLQTYTYRADMVLEEGDYFYCTYYDMTLNDGARFESSGYVMIVPE